VAHEHAQRRLMTMNPVNSVYIWIAGTDLATIRIDLHLDPQRLS